MKFVDSLNSIPEFKRNFKRIFTILVSSLCLSLALYSLPKIENAKAAAPSPDKPYPECIHSSIPITDILRLKSEGIFITDDSCLVENKSVTTTKTFTLNPQPFQSPVYKYVFYNPGGQNFPTFEPLGYRTLPITLTNGGWFVASLFTHVDVHNSDVISFPVFGSHEHGPFLSYEAPLGKLGLVGELQRSKSLTTTALINFVLFVNGQRQDEFIKIEKGQAIRFSIHSTLTYGINIFGSPSLVGLFEKYELTSKIVGRSLVGNTPPVETDVYLPLVGK